MEKDKLNPDPHNADQAIADTIAELDKPEETPTDKPDETEKPEEDVAPDDTDKPDETPDEDKKPEDYKEKFSNSSREASILAAKLRKQNEAIEKAGTISAPTEEEMRSEFPEWEEMSATERRLATDSVWNNRRFGLIEGVAKESKDIEAWNGKVDTFVDDPKTLIKYPRLEGKADGFKAFCTKDTRRGVDFEDLVSAYLFKVDSERKPHKGQMFEKPSGGANDAPKPKSDKLSVDEAAKLMETDYGKWQELLLAGKLDDGSGQAQAS